MSKCRRPIRSQNHQKCYHKAFTTLDIHKHCQLPMLSACQWQPRTCQEHSTISRREDARAMPSPRQALKQGFVFFLLNGVGKKRNPSAAGVFGPQNLSVSLKRNLKGVGKYFDPSMHRKSTLNGSAMVPGASLQLHLNVIQLPVPEKQPVFRCTRKAILQQPFTGGVLQRPRPHRVSPGLVKDHLPLRAQF